MANPQYDHVPAYWNFRHLEKRFPWLAELHEAKENDCFKLPPVEHIEIANERLPRKFRKQLTPVPLSEVVKFANLILLDAPYLEMLVALWDRDSDGDDYSADEEYLLAAYPQYFVWKFRPAVPNVEYYWEARFLAIKAHKMDLQMVIIDTALTERLKPNSRIDFGK